MLAPLAYLLVFGASALGSVAMAQGASSCIRAAMVNLPPADEVTLAAIQIVREISDNISVASEVKVVPCSFFSGSVSALKIPDGETATVDSPIPPGEYMIYNPTWLRETTAYNRFQAIFLFAHEFGHFVNRHFDVHMRKLPRVKELEADQFAACSSARLGAQWADLDDLLQRLRTEVSELYPSLVESRDVVRRKFEECGGSLSCPELSAHSFRQSMIFVTRFGEALTELPSHSTVCGVEGDIDRYRHHGLPSDINVLTVVAGRRVLEMVRGNCSAAAFWEKLPGGNILGLDREFRNMKSFGISQCDISVIARD